MPRGNCKNIKSSKPGNEKSILPIEITFSKNMIRMDSQKIVHQSFKHSVKV